MVPGLHKEEFRLFNGAVIKSKCFDFAAPVKKLLFFFLFSGWAINQTFFSSVLSFGFLNIPFSSGSKKHVRKQYFVQRKGNDIIINRRGRLWYRSTSFLNYLFLFNEISVNWLCFTGSTVMEFAKHILAKDSRTCLLDAKSCSPLQRKRKTGCATLVYVQLLY